MTSGVYYQPSTLKVWNDYLDIVSDHRLVTCKLSCQVDLTEEKMKSEQKEKTMHRLVLSQTVLDPRQ